MPFSNAHRERLARQIKDIVISTIYGGIIVALVQGLIGSFTFGLLGLRSPILWGLAISMSSFLPVVGSAIIWVPTALWLLLKGSVATGLVMLSVGIFAIAVVDNVMRPILIRGRLRMPLLVIFFSVFGGIQLFGLIGLVMGPLVLGVFVSVVDIFKDVEREYE